MKDILKEVVVCSRCGGSLNFSPDVAICNKCNSRFSIKEGRIFFIEPPSDTPHRQELSSDELTSKENFSDLRRETYLHLMKEIKDLKDGIRLLDLSAGRSVYRKEFARFSTISTDFYPFDLIDVVADTSGIAPFKDGAFDVVFMSHVLEHMPIPELTLKECFRILKPGGLLIAHTPFMLGLHDEPYDFFRYTKYAIQSMLGRTGFEKMEVESISDFYDIYETINRDFFGALISSIKPDSFKNKLKLLFFRIIRKVQTSTIRVFKPFYKGIRDERYPKAYGFVAYRPRT